MTAPARIEAFARAADALSAHCDAGVREIGLAMLGWLGGTGPLTLEAALGLKRDIDLGKLLKKRNLLLRRLRCRHLPAGFSCEADAQDMARQLSAYFGDAWQQDRIMAVCPYRRDSLLEGYWCVLKLVPHPLSARHLRRILAIQ